MQWIKDLLIWIWWHPFKALLQRLPVRAAYGAGRAIARTTALLPLPLARDMERAAIPALGAGADPALRRTAAREGMFCFLMNEIETLLFPCLDAEDMDFAAPVKGLALLDQALADGKGTILLLSHFGANQMVMPALGFRGYRLNQVSAPATTLNDRLPEDRPGWVRRTRVLRWEHERTLPVTHINGLGNLAAALDCLRRGEVLAIAGDGGHSSAPVRVPFLGREAHFPAGAMLLARRTGSPVLPVFVLREASGRNIVIIEPPLETLHTPAPSKEAAAEAGVREFAARLEQRVRAHPGHYLRHLAFREHMAQVDAVPFWADGTEP
jgi:KDO2-lipid IV(A) lauroyltransferase